MFSHFKLTVSLCTILKVTGTANELHHCINLSLAPKVTTRFQSKSSIRIANKLGHRALRDTLAIASLASKLSK
jgi:hypothetical protein